MLFSTKFLAEVFENNSLKNNQIIEIQQVATDTRKKADESLFVPLKGDSFDGHDFIEAAIEKGAVAALWEKDNPVPESIQEGFPLFFVDDTLVALQHLSRQYLKNISPTVIGVTGSNGKTTTKDLIGAVLSTQYRTHRTNGNFNNHIGLPLTILSMPNTTEVIVLEMGMNQFGEIELLSKLAEPDFAVITNIGESHIENLGSREGIAKAKMEIISGMGKSGVIVYDGDEPLLDSLGEHPHAKSCGFGERNKLVIEEVNMHSDFSTFSIKNKSEYKLGMLGKHNVKNAGFAIEVAHQLNVPEEKIKKALEKVELTGMRFELLKGKDGSTIINDAYNASPTSMKASIEVMKDMNAYPNKVLVLGDIFELGDHAEELHKSVAGTINTDFEALLTIGEYSKLIGQEVKKNGNDINIIHFEEMESLTDYLQRYLKPEYLILLKASRGMKLERILKDIQ